MTPYIVHLTPSLQDHEQDLSQNLGDIIIYKSIEPILIELFPNTEIIKLSTHDYLESNHIRLIKKAQHTFVGGSNLLSSNINQYNQWKYSKSRWDYFFPNITNINLIGVGWWQYQHAPTFKTAHFYKSLFSKKKKLSVRDSYTLKQLQQCGIKNVINTSCPTTWNLNGIKTNKTQQVSSCLFSLTDYNPAPVLDNALIELLAASYHQLFFFPQGSKDIEYINILSNFIKYKNKIIIIERNIEAASTLLSNYKQDLNYIGTRLHLGIYCLQYKIPSLIISIDNRAFEIAKDINLPVVERHEIAKIKEWINNASPESSIHIPLNAINDWKQQFK